jgi:protein O-mannosyl-transferase
MTVPANLNGAQPNGASPTHIVRAQRNLEIIFVSSLILLTVVCYGNMLTNGFVYDDQQQILQNPYIKSWHFLPQIFNSTVWSFVGEVGATNYYRPLMTLTYLILWTAFGSIPIGFHLFSLALHIAVVVMVFYTGKQLLQAWRPALLAAVLFAVHPIHTEAVDWIAAVPDLEMALFFLVVFYLYISRKERDWKRWALLLTFFTLALLSKEPALMLLPIVAAFEYLNDATPVHSKPYKRILSCWPFAVIAVFYLALRIALFGKLAPVLQHPQVSWPEAAYSGLSLIFGYAKLLVWPSSLSAFHVFHPTSSLSELDSIAGAIILAALLGAFVFLTKRSVIVVFCLFWTAITLLPVLNPRWMAANVQTERYLYLPSVGFCWLISWCSFATVRAFRGGRRGQIAFQVVVLGGFTVLCLLGVKETITRNRDWRSDEALYTQTLRTDPHAYPILLNLGLTYHQTRDPQRAEHEYKLALNERPDGVNVLNDLGVLYFEQQRFAESAEMLKQAIAVKPLWAEPHYNYGRLLEKHDDLEAALKEFRLATKLAPLNATAHLYYADGLMAAGNLAEAASEYDRSITLGSSLEAEQGLAQIYIRTGNRSAAEAMLRRIIAESPYDGSSHLSLAQLLEEDRRFNEALSEYGKVLQTDPHNSETRAAIERLEKSESDPKR